MHCDMGLFFLPKRVQGELSGLGNTFGFPKSRPGMGLLTNDCLFLGLNKSVPSRNSKEDFLCDGSGVDNL